MLLKKSLTHAGVLISLIILVVLLLVNWNKCLVNPIEQWLRPQLVASSSVSINQPKTAEGFNTDITTATNKGVETRDITLELSPTRKEVKVGFTGLFDADVPTNYVIKGYLLVMAKYDINLEKVGALDVKMTEESSGRTFITERNAFIAKYTGSLSTPKKDSITALSEANTTTFQVVLKAFLASTNDNVLLTEFNNLTIQDINMFFELLGLVYKYQLSSTTSPKLLKAIYDEFRMVYPALNAIQANQTPKPSGDPNYDYLQISVSTTDKNKEAANDLSKAMANYAVLRTVLNPTGDIAGQPKKMVVDELRKFLQGLIGQILNGYDQVINTICNPENKKCGFTFTQVEPADPQGNIYYYKLGIGVVFVNKNTGEEVLSKIKAFSFGQGNKLQYFRVDTNLDDQEKLLKQLAELARMNAQRALQQPQQQQLSSSSDCQGAAGMNAYMTMLKSYLGNYPDEFLMGTAQGKELTLDRYFTESLANGQINISADFSGLTPSTTSAAGRF